MNLWLRMLIILIGSHFRPRLTSIFDPSEIDVRVMPNDLDINFHMNNGRYLTHMDLGRYDLLLRSGLWLLVRQNGSVPVLGSAQIRYRMGLDAFEKYRLRTQVVGWDQKWIFIEQRFIKLSGPHRGEVAAIGLVKGAFYNQSEKRTLPTEAVLRVLNEEISYPDHPEHISSWQEAEEKLRKLTARN